MILEDVHTALQSYQDELSPQFPQPFLLVQGYSVEVGYAQPVYWLLDETFSIPMQRIVHYIHPQYQEDRED